MKPSTQELKSSAITASIGMMQTVKDMNHLQKRKMMIAQVRKPTFAVSAENSKSFTSIQYSLYSL